MKRLNEKRKIDNVSFFVSYALNVVVMQSNQAKKTSLAVNIVWIGLHSRLRRLFKAFDTVSNLSMRGSTSGGAYCKLRMFVRSGSNQWLAGGRTPHFDTSREERKHDTV